MPEFLCQARHAQLSEENVTILQLSGMGNVQRNREICEIYKRICSQLAIRVEKTKNLGLITGFMPVYHDPSFQATL